MVEVYDLDKPWEPFHVTSLPSHVIQLQWDPTGSKLLVINEESTCQVWVMEVGMFLSGLVRKGTLESFQIRMHSYSKGPEM